MESAKAVKCTFRDDFLLFGGLFLVFVRHKKVNQMTYVLYKINFL
jgi:hypothetical protein